MPDGFDVFLSHNSRDKPVVEEIGALLEGQGLRVWLDKKELRPGLPWQEALEGGIQASRAVAIFIGLDGLGAWQEPEARAFIARSRSEKIPVIPVLLPACPESPQLTLFLEPFTWVDLRKEVTDDGLAHLVWGITGKRPDGKGAIVASTTPRFTASVALAAAGARVLLVARDLEDHPLAGFHFSYGGSVSRATNPAGATWLDLPPGIGPGQQIKILLVHRSKKTEDWFLVNPQVNIPTGSGSAELVLMRRSDFRQIAAEARDSQQAKALRSDEQLTAEAPKQALIEAAARHGLTVEQLESAILSFAETQDPKDRGIAVYLGRQNQQAKDLLKGAIQKKSGRGQRMLDGFDALLSHKSRYKPLAKGIGALREEQNVSLSPIAPARTRAMSQRKWWNWSTAVSLLALIVALAAWLWPLPPTSSPQPGKPGIYAVRVQVLDPLGCPIEGATVRTSTGNEPHRLPDGWWEIEIPSVKVPKDGRISLWADHQDWTGGRSDLTLGDDPSPRAEIHLKEPESWIRGQVETKGALGGILISRKDGGPGKAITDPEGHFDLKLPEPAGKKVRLRAERAGSEIGDKFCLTGADNCSIFVERP